MRDDVTAVRRTGIHGAATATAHVLALARRGAILTLGAIAAIASANRWVLGGAVTAIVGQRIALSRFATDTPPTSRDRQRRRRIALARSAARRRRRRRGAGAAR
jgi:hypothetical protein